MRVAAICTSVTLALVPTSTAVAEVEFGKVVAYKGICEPSGAIAFPAGTIDQVFIVANDDPTAWRPMVQELAAGTRWTCRAATSTSSFGLNDERRGRQQSGLRGSDLAERQGLLDRLT